MTIQKHILGNLTLDSPYKLISADVNQSGNITVGDILELRKIILMDITEFSNNESWQFIPQDYEFIDPTNPLAEDYPTAAEIDLKFQDVEVSFIGVKIGDVNNSAVPNDFLVAEDRSKTNESFPIYLKDQVIRGGETKEIQFRVEDFEAIDGLQATLQFDPTKIRVDKIGWTEQFPASSFGQSLLDKGLLLTSWVKSPNWEFTEAPLFSLSITAKETGSLSDFLGFHENILKPEAYAVAGKVLPLELQFTEVDNQNNSGVQLQQNQPNPFSETTVITYQLPENGSVTINLFDINGSLHKSFQSNGIKGSNEFVFNRHDFTNGGVYFYQLNTPFGQIMKKMIYIDK